MWIQQFSYVLHDILCDRLRLAQTTTSDQSTSTAGYIIVFMDTYVALKSASPQVTEL